MKIRIAAAEDIPEIEELYRQLFAAMAEIQPEFIRPGSQDESFIRMNMESEEADILTAWEEEKMVGFLMVQQKSAPPYECFIPHRFACIMDLAVDEKHRGKGIGTSLLKEAEAWAVKRGLEYIELGVLAGNFSAEGLYEKMGYRDTQKTMRHML